MLETDSYTANVMFLFRSSRKLTPHIWDTVRVTLKCNMSVTCIFVDSHLGAMGDFVMYTGDFTKYRSILKNEFVLNILRQSDTRIKYVYMDNTLVDSVKKNSLLETCQSIVTLVRLVFLDGLCIPLPELLFEFFITVTILNFYFVWNFQSQDMKIC